MSGFFFVFSEISEPIHDSMIDTHADVLCIAGAGHSVFNVRMNAT